MSRFGSVTGIMTVHSKQPTAAHRVRVAPSDAHDDGDDAPVAATAAVAGTGKILPPPANFALLLLEPVRVKYLRLTDNLAIQDEGLAGPGEPGGDWVCTRINP